MLNRRTLLSITAAATLAPTLSLAKGGKMTAEDAYQAMQDGTLILIDVRRPEEWVQTGVAQGHGCWI